MRNDFPTSKQSVCSNLRIAQKFLYKYSKNHLYHQQTFENQDCKSTEDL